MSELVFVKEQRNGRLDVTPIGEAPMSPDLKEFLRVQGYGTGAFKNIDTGERVMCLTNDKGGFVLTRDELEKLAEKVQEDD